MPTHDRQRSTPFEYWRCDAGHGRLMTFFNFLREKDFVRPLSGDQLEALKRDVQIVNCSNCGAPIDLNTASTCPHCGSPVSMLDMQHAEALVSELRSAALPKSPPPDLALQLAMARQQAEDAFALAGEDRPAADGPGLVEAGLVAVLRRMKHA
jgi:hypothetical protein